MKSHVLIISENKHHKMLLRTKLSDFSLIFMTENAALTEAFSYLQISFILIDQFPEENTLKIIGAIKNKTERIPIFVIHNSLQKDYIRSLISSGATELIAMPIDNVDFSQIITNVIGKKIRSKKIEQLALPKKTEEDVSLEKKQVIDQEAVAHVKAVLQKGGLITLALVGTSIVPNSGEDLVLKVKDGLFCVISIKKGRKELLDTLRQGTKEKFYTGIVSSVKKPYTDIAMMLEDAEHALERAKETPYGYSF